MLPGGKINELAYIYSYEDWFIRMIYKQYGENNGKKILAGLNQTPKVTVRVNNNKADYDEVYDKTLELIGKNGTYFEKKWKNPLLNCAEIY